jgi:hypothetical protein
MSYGMNEYYCEYYSTDGKRYGERVWAYTALDARKKVEYNHDFARHGRYPEKLS